MRDSLAPNDIGHNTFCGGRNAISGVRLDFSRPSAGRTSWLLTNGEGEPVQSYQNPRGHLKTLTRNTGRISGSGVMFDKLSELTATQTPICKVIPAYSMYFSHEGIVRALSRSASRSP
jgi:hypothetical protein